MHRHKCRRFYNENVLHKTHIPMRMFQHIATGSDSDSNILETIQKADVVGFFGQ